MTSYSISVRPYGNHAILVEWPQEVEEHILKDILDFTTFLKSECLDPSKFEIVPSYNSITLVCRQTKIDFDAYQKKLNTWYVEKKPTKAKRYLWRLPVCYDLEFGIDLVEVANQLSVDISEVIHQHAQHRYTVYGIGFLPGFMYLGGLPTSLETYRKAEPRLNVLKGSVGLAGKQTGIYPQNSPGGWNIIGSCPVAMFNATREEPCFVNVGDQVQFYPITKSAYELLKIEIEVGIYKLEKLELDA